MPAAKYSSVESESGLLYVVTRAKAGYEEDYREWYNTEHGPLRVQLDFVRNGYRYREARLPESAMGEEGDGLTFMAMYDLSRVSALEEAEYAKMRSQRSARESEVLAKKMDLVDRRVYTLMSSCGISKGPAPVVMAVTLVVRGGLKEDVHRWYEEEHTRDLSKIPGWRGTRRYRRVAVDNEQRQPEVVELLAVHEFEHLNGLDGPEHVYARNRPWRNGIMSQVETKENRRWSFFHEFKASDYRPP